MDNLISKYYRYRSRYWRWQRIFFPSPAELRLIEIMGGRYFRIKWLRLYKTGFSFAIVYSLGKYLGDEKFMREVRCGRYFIDFGNDIRMGIEVDGKKWHRDVVAEFERDSYFYQNGWRVKRIQAVRLWNEPSRVQAELLNFLYS